MKLYTTANSSAAYRVRIALNLKGLKAEQIPVSLLKGEHATAEYGAVNPQELVPTLVDGKHSIGQSLAIIEYLEETHPQKPLLPRDAAGRARVRQIALVVACEMHPLNNLRVRNYLKQEFGLPEERVDKEWYAHWLRRGFDAIEAILRGPDTGKFCHGDTPTMADVFLVPQVFNARRFKVPMDAYPTIMRVDEAARALPAFAAAAPEKQQDAQR